MGFHMKVCSFSNIILQLILLLQLMKYVPGAS